MPGIHTLKTASTLTRPSLKSEKGRLGQLKASTAGLLPLLSRATGRFGVRDADPSPQGEPGRGRSLPLVSLRRRVDEVGLPISIDDNAGQIHEAITKAVNMQIH